VVCDLITKKLMIVLHIFDKELSEMVEVNIIESGDDYAFT